MVIVRLPQCYLVLLGCHQTKRDSEELDERLEIRPPTAATENGGLTGVGIQLSRGRNPPTPLYKRGNIRETILVSGLER